MTDGKRARKVAEELEAQAGAHIAFEEEELYPRLISIVGRIEVEKMRAHHAEALQSIQRLLSASESLDEVERKRLLEQSEQMETHIAECGELFGALEALGIDQQSDLNERLVQWRERSPSWTDYANARDEARGEDDDSS